MNKKQQAELTEAGFTLIEMLLVILIMGLMLSIVLPRVQVAAGLQVRTAARHLAGTIRYVYSITASKRVPYRLKYDLDENSYWIEYPKANITEGTLEAAKLTDSIIKGQVKLNSYVMFADVHTLHDGKRTEGQTFTQFFSHGFIEPTTIHLIDTDENYYTLYIMPLTGNVIIYDGYKEISGEGELLDE